ncbi:FAD-binding oxidoreductase [Kitasatospora sp. NPDC059646]|uniref:FAD-binding oxidoreductase n=1 Tax=Kitasatospora sp. NPDC059646 TaxID=3346893 RepID=UPI003699C109
MISRRNVLLAGAGAAALTGLPVTPGQAAPRRPRASAAVPWSRLDDALQGRLVLPSQPEYTLARQLDLGQFDAANPQAIAYCANPADVAACLRFAQAAGLPFAVRAGGHSGAGYSTSTGLVVDVTGLNQVTVGASTVTVGGGAQGVDVVNALAPYGLAVPGGYCPTVGVGGYYQGGGMGALTRSVGLGSDRLASAQVVLADGRSVTASPTCHSDLFWALRGGGGGNFGVVTAYELKPSPVTQLGFVRLPWAWDKAVDVLDGFAHWLVDAPRTVGAALLVELPDAAPGNAPVPAVYLLSTGTATELDAEAARLIAMVGSAPVARPAAAMMPYRSAMMALYGCASYTTDQCHRSDNTAGGMLSRQEFGMVRSRMFGAPPSRAMWAQVVALFETERLAGHTRALEIWPFNGAAQDAGPSDTAFVHRSTLLSVSFLAAIRSAAVADAAGCAAGKRFVDAGFAAIDPESSGTTYQNFTDAALTDWRQAYYGANYARLVRIKQSYDPYWAFSFGQAIGA